MKPGEQNLMG